MPPPTVGRGRGFSPGRSRRRRRQRVVAHHPREARRDRDDEHHRRGDDRVGPRAAGLEPLPDRPQLHADQHEREGVQHEDHGLPHGEDRHAHARRHLRRRHRRAIVIANATSVRMPESPMRFGRDPDAEGAGELDDQRDRHVAQAGASTARITNAQAMPAARLPKTVSRNTGAKLPKPSWPGHHRHDREPVDEQRAGVVQQAFAFEDLQQPVRQLHLAHHRGRRGRVGRRDDRAERDRDRPGHVRAPASGRRARPPPPSCRPRRRRARRPAASSPAGRAARCRRPRRPAPARRRASARAAGRASSSGSSGTNASSAPPSARKVG